tara:strand:- start:153 stop:512 length:360 start_codon:yes stop_codon:yes gene_type:complete
MGWPTLRYDEGMKPITENRLKMNKLEKRYGDYLNQLKMAGEIIDYRYEAFSLKIGFNCRYHFDFFVVTKDEFQIHETKGFMRDDARVKLMGAAASFPWFRFFLVKAEGRSFKISEIKPG